MDESPRLPRRTSGGAALLAGLLIAGSAIGAMFWQLSQKEKPVAVNIGLDSVSPRENPQSAPYQPAAPKSGLDMINAGVPVKDAAGRASVQAPASAAPGQGPTGQARGDAGSAFTKAVRQSEARAQALAVEYTKRYPAIAQYGRDWMSYPDLKKLTYDYRDDHDPVKFLRGLAGSKSFPELAAKYARDPAVQAFVKDALKDMPHDVLAASSGMLVQDGILRALLSDTGKALGLPQAFTEGLAHYETTSQLPASAPTPALPAQ